MNNSPAVSDMWHCESQAVDIYFSSCRSLCRSSWVAMGSEMSEAMLGVGSLTETWLGEARRLEELLPRSHWAAGLASGGGAFSSTPGLSPPPVTGVDGVVLLPLVPGDADTWGLTGSFLPSLDTEGRFT